MAGSIIGRLRVALALDSAEFQRGAAAARGQVSSLRGQFAGIATVVAAAGASIVAFARRAGAQIDAQAKLAQSLSTTTRSIQTLQRAGDLAGVGMSGVEQATKDLTRRLSQAAGGAGPAVAALDRLGLSARELMDMPLDERVRVIGEAIEEMIPAPERAAVFGQLFGEEGSIAALRLARTIRQASDEMARLGLGIDQIDAGRVETANDQFSQLGLVFRHVGQQIAVAVLPPLGQMVEAMVRAFEPGRLLRETFDGWTASLGRTAAAIGGTVRTIIGLVEWAERVGMAVRDFLGGFDLLRAVGSAFSNAIAPIRNVGSGVLTVLETVGMLGEAMPHLGAVAVEVWGRIKAGAELVQVGTAAAWVAMQAGFLRAVGAMLAGFVEFTWTVAEGLNGLFGTNLSGMSGEGTQALNRTILALDDQVAGLSGRANDLAVSLAAPLGSVEAMRAAMAGTAEAVAGLNAELDNLGADGAGEGGTGGGSGGRAADAMNKVAEATDAAKDRFAEFESSAGQAFVSIVTGAKSAREALSEMLASFAQVLANRAFQGLWGALFPAAAPAVAAANGAVISGGRVMAFANGGIVGGPTLFPMAGGRTGLMGEAGPEAIFPLERIGGKLGIRAQGGGDVTINIDARGAQQGVAAEIAAAMPEIERRAVAAVRAAERRGRLG